MAYGEVRLKIGDVWEWHLIDDLKSVFVLYPGAEAEHGGTAYLDDDWETEGYISPDDVKLVMKLRPEIIEYSEFMTFLSTLADPPSTQRLFEKLSNTEAEITPEEWEAELKEA